jgi:hypothetical protein
MSNAKYNSRDELLAKSSKIVRYGKYTELPDEDGYPITKVIKSIDKATFYKLYLELNNVIGLRQQGEQVIDTVLPPVPLELLVHLMLKNSDFTIVFRNKDATLVKLGEELGKTASSVYSNLSKLRKTGYIIKDEDNLLVLNKELKDLIKFVDTATRGGKALKFDFLFKFCVT